MIAITLNDGRKLVTESSYDSGVHTGIHSYISGASRYTTSTLDTILTKDEINELELMILTYVYGKLSNE